MQGRWRHHVATITFHIESRLEDVTAHCSFRRSSKVIVKAATAGFRHQRVWEVAMFAQKLGEAVVASVARVNIQHH
jgi:hypothetical protein